MWEVWSYPDYSYTEGEGVLEGTYETLSGAEGFCADIKRPLRIVRARDLPPDEFTADEVIDYLDEHWNYHEFREMVADVKKRFGRGAR